MDKDFLHKIGIPDTELIDLTFFLKYRFMESLIPQQYPQSISYTSMWRLEIKIEAINIATNDPMRSRYVSLNLFKISFLYKNIEFEVANSFVKGKQKVTNILIAPLEDMPLHINDPEPFCELAAWRLMLPKISVDYGSSEYSFWNQIRPLSTL